MKKTRNSPSKTQASQKGTTTSHNDSELQLLKINESRLDIFLEGLENYEFQVKNHPPSYKQLIDSRTFFDHFYGILKMFVNQENDLSLGRILVLYGVGQKLRKGASIRAKVAYQHLHRLVYLRTGAVLSRKPGGGVRD
jgi:hypothetical protein